MLAKTELPATTHQTLARFLDALQQAYGAGLTAIDLVGSGATGDYEPQSSDLNLLVLFSDQHTYDLGTVAQMAREWQSETRLAPRFLSVRNVHESLDYHALDFWTMQQAHRHLWGDEILANIQIKPDRLRWQCAHEISAIRMRFKQEFWSLSPRPLELAHTMLDHYTTFVLLLRAHFFLQAGTVLARRSELMDLAVSSGILDAALVRDIRVFRRSPSPEGALPLIKKPERFMDAIRALHDLFVATP